MGFVVSHPFRRKKRKGRGTQVIWENQGWATSHRSFWGGQKWIPPAHRDNKAAMNGHSFPCLIVTLRGECPGHLPPSIVCCRGSPQDRGDHNPALLKIKVIDDPVVSHPAPPCGQCSLKSLEIALKRIILHGDQRCFNARLIALRKLSKVLLRRSGEDEVPRH